MHASTLMLSAAIASLVACESIATGRSASPLSSLAETDEPQRRVCPHGVTVTQNGAVMGLSRAVDRVIGCPARLDDGRWVMARGGGGPGESDLWVLDGDALRPVTFARGPDDAPLVTEGSNVLFVSGRSGVASLWLLDVDRAEPIALTNRGRKIRDGAGPFTPLPVGAIQVDGSYATYTAGDGTVWAVALDGAGARRVR